MHRQEILDHVRNIILATNNGLYRSEDGGQNWILAKPGDIRRIF